MTVPMLLRLLTILAVCLAATTARAQLPDPAPASITWLGGPGVMIEYGQAKVLIDAPHRATGATADAVLAAAPPYDGVTDLFVTAMAPDRFEAAAVNGYLDRQTGSWGVAPADIIRQWAGTDGPAIPRHARLVALAGRNGEISHLNHGPWFIWSYVQTGEAPDTRLGYRIAIPPEPLGVEASKARGIRPEDFTVLHIAAITDRAALAPLRDAFAGQPSDIAIASPEIADMPGLAAFLNTSRVVVAGQGALAVPGTALTIDPADPL